MTIRNDATRHQVRAADRRRPRSVSARQGLALTDADLDLGAAAILARVEDADADMMGPRGRLLVRAPAGAFGASLASPGAAGVVFGGGWGWLGGWMIEAVEPFTLASQPHARSEAPPSAPYLLALKALLRHVDPVEEPALADPALGDAQAAGRTIVDWQVFALPLTGLTAPGCATIAGWLPWTRLITPSIGTMTVVPDPAPPTEDPCSLTPQGGYSRLENLLYRIEVHGGIPRSDHPDADGPRFGLAGLQVKMSRRNASVMARVAAVSGVDLTVSPPAPDPHNWFAPGAWAEIVGPDDDLDPRDALASERLHRVASASDERVRLAASAAPAAAALAARIAAQPGRWHLRLWDAMPDGAGVATASAPGLAAVSDPVPLGDGLSLRFGGGATATFRRGDSWTFAARADGSLDWPPGAFEPPHGPETRYAPLAVVSGGTAPVVEDCRLPFAALTDRVLHYRGGDGQSATPPPGGGFVTLGALLRVAVMRGRTPVVGARVEWSTPTGALPSRIAGQPVSAAVPVMLTTDADGLCAAPWSINAQHREAIHRIRAALADPADAATAQPVEFSATFRTAASVGYMPGACTLLNAAEDVQQALDILCANIGGARPDVLSLTRIDLHSRRGGVTPLIRDDLILNGLEVAPDAFDERIVIEMDGGPLLGAPEPFDPLLEVELDLPYPVTDPDRFFWIEIARQRRTATGAGGNVLPGMFGFQRVRLDGLVKLGDNVVSWEPTEPARAFLAAWRQHAFGYTATPGSLADLRGVGFSIPGPSRLLCRLRLRAAHVWAEDSRTGARIYLNAEHAGTSEAATRRELLLKSMDPQRIADLEMFLYLAIG
ncbi:MAG: DUF6519 domain-containing protein [Rubrimonas sp.]